MLVPLVLAATLFPSTADGTAIISNGRYSVEVNDFGVLVKVPGSGLANVDGPRVVMTDEPREWFGLAYRASTQLQAVGVGTAPDWGARDPVERVLFEASDSSVRAVTRTAELTITTRFEFESGSDLMMMVVEFENRSGGVVRDFLYSREWGVPELVGFSFPPDLHHPLDLPPQISRSLWMLDDLAAGASVSLTLAYAPPAGLPPAMVDVPLALWTNATWPGGLTIGATNGVSWGDYDADGWPDFFATESRQLWRNLSGQDWELARTIGIQPGVIRYGCSFGDYNNDGLPDIATEPRKQTSYPFMHLLKNLGGGPNFLDVAIDRNIVDVQPFGDSETISWADVDFDGNLDMFVPVYPPWAFNGPGNFFLYNLGPTGPGGAYRFTEISAAAGLDNPAGSARPEGAEFCDTDFDGDLEMYSNGTLYQNHSSPGTPLFLPMTEAASGFEFSVFYDEGCGFFDADMDGDYDLAIAYCVGNAGTRIFENLGDGMFSVLPANIIDSSGAGLCLGLSHADWDNDGDIDFTTRQVFRRNMLMETGDLHFTVATHSIPGNHLTSATPAWCDWDVDGDLDCLLGNWFSIGHFYENTHYDADTPDADRRYVRVRVLNDDEGRGPETEYGASVEIRVRGENRKRIQLVSSSGGYLNQNEYDLHFAMPDDPAPGDPDEDLRFDVMVTFNSDPAVGVERVDQWVNPQLGNLNLADLFDRSIVVYRSGRALVNGCEFLPHAAADRVMTTTSDGLALATDTVPLPGLVPSPGSDWFVGLEFDTLIASGPQRIKEIILDGRPARVGTDCGNGDVKIAVWDVTNPAAPFVVENGTLSPPRRRRNSRHHILANTVVDPGRTYRLVAEVTDLRPNPINAPVAHGSITVQGGLSFQDLNPCTGVAVAAAPVDLANVYVAIRFVDDPGDLWVDVGHGFAGNQTPASLTGSGSLDAGEIVSLQLAGGPASTTTVLVVGLEPLCVPIRSATMVPRPDLLVMVFTDGGGGFTVSNAWPAGLAPGSHVFGQVFYLDNTVPGGLAASNAVSATTDFQE